VESAQKSHRSPGSLLLLCPQASRCRVHPEPSVAGTRSSHAGLSCTRGKLGQDQMYKLTAEVSSGSLASPSLQSLSRTLGTRVWGESLFHPRRLGQSKELLALRLFWIPGPSVQGPCSWTGKKSLAMFVMTNVGVEGGSPPVVLAPLPGTSDFSFCVARQSCWARS
jgi:hypothetical protein